MTFSKIQSFDLLYFLKKLFINCVSSFIFYRFEIIKENCFYFSNNKFNILFFTCPFLLFFINFFIIFLLFFYYFYYP